MTDRPKAKHTLEIIIEPTWKPAAYFKCHGDQDSACWWGIDSEKGEDAEPQSFGKCIYAEWDEASSGIVEGCFEVPLVQVAWGEEPCFSVDPDWIEAHTKVSAGKPEPMYSVYTSNGFLWCVRRKGDEGWTAAFDTSDPDAERYAREFADERNREVSGD